MLQRVFKLSPDDYESLYSGTPVVKTGITLSLNDSTHVLTVTENGETITINSGDYIINIEDKYLTPDETEEMFDDIDTVASTQDVANLFGTVSPEARQFIIDLIYPVGSIYRTDKSEEQFNPNTAWGGTWEKIEGKFLLSSSSSYALGSTGGSSKHTPSGSIIINGHTLTIDEIPSHEHRITFVVGNNGDYNAYPPMTNSSATVIGTVGTSKTGGDQAHSHTGSFTGTEQNTMPPYIVVTTWKRTA